jgi:hypothetical protein
MKIIKLSLVVMIALAALNFSAYAGQASRPGKRVTPRTVVLSLYNQHKRQSPFFQTRSRALLDKYFASELANLLWEEARSSRGEVGALEADPLFNAQDTRVKNFSVQEGTVGTGPTEVAVSFENFREKHKIMFLMIPEGTGGRITDIAYDDGRSLREILRRYRDSAKRGQVIKVYLVAVGDDGKAGKKIGCDDSLVAVTRTISKTVAPLSAAIAQLLATPQHPAENPKLENFWKGRDLKIKSVSIRNNTATIYISGEVFVAGVCDIPRIESQIEATARQFPNVKRVKVFIGGRTLRDAIR